MVKLLVEYTMFILSIAIGSRALAQLDEEQGRASVETAPLDMLTYEPSEESMVDSPDKGPKDDPIQKRSHGGLVTGAKVGAGFGQPFNESGSSFVLELEAGYLLPLPDPIYEGFEVFVSGQYSQPVTDGKSVEPDPRLPGDGIVHFEITQQRLVFTLGVLYRVPLAIDFLRPYIAVGGRIYLIRSLIEAEVAEERFGRNEETATEPGWYGALGTDLFLGPGAVLLEFQIAHAGLDGTVFQNTNLAALTIVTGYRIIL